MTRVEAPSRLHFGLLSVPVEGQTHWPDLDGRPELPIRAFGGVGLMIDRPGVVVESRPARVWSAQGLHAERALAFARAFVYTLPENERGCFDVRVKLCPPEHIGLGVGTSLGLSVAKALAVELGYSDWDSVELARRVGRGKRSAVGVHGFQLGGLIVEAGKLPGEEMAPLVGRYEFPKMWRIRLLQPRQPSNWHGQREAKAFARSHQNNDTRNLCTILVTGILPALVAADFDRFSEALHEFNLRAGRAFQIEQGGHYSSAETGVAISWLRNRGAICAGQTSWGPTVFALFPDDSAANQMLREPPECVRGHFRILECAATSRGFRCCRA